MRFFRKRQEPTPTTPTHEFIQVRSYYSQATHVLKTGSDNAICGYSNWLPTNTVMSVDADFVMSTIKNQHEGWFWCRYCASELTGLPKDTFTRTI